MLLATGGAIGGARITIEDATISDIVGSPGTAGATYQLTPGGDITHNFVDSGDWIVPNNAAPGLYEVRATVTSGSISSGDATGSWLALTSTRTWTVTRDIVGLSSATLTIEIRLGTTVLDTATVTLAAEVSL